jgi:hypothetical protein
VPDPRLEEFTDALNRNTGRLQSLEEATVRLYDRLGEYLVELQRCTKEIMDAREEMKRRRR